MKVALRELASVTARLHYNICERLWQSWEVPDDTNIRLIFRKGKNALRNYRPAILTSVPEKVMEQILLDSFSRAYDGLEVTGSSQQGFTTGKYCLSNLTASCDEKTSSVADGKAVGVIYPVFTRNFRIVSHTIL